MKANVYRSIYLGHLAYQSETWAVAVDDMARLERTDQIIVR